VAESDGDIAAALVRLLDDPGLCARLARQGRARVEARYAWEANLPRLDGWLEALAARPPRMPPSPSPEGAARPGDSIRSDGGRHRDR
jgi:glycosyl transferase family 1